MKTLEAIGRRYSTALDAKPGKSGITKLDALIDSVADIPQLLRALEAAQDVPLLTDHKHGDLNFMDGWASAIEEVQARISEALEMEPSLRATPSEAAPGPLSGNLRA